MENVKKEQTESKSECSTVQPIEENFSSKLSKKIATNLANRDIREE